MIKIYYKNEEKYEVDKLIDFYDLWEEDDALRLAIKQDYLNEFSEVKELDTKSYLNSWIRITLTIYNESAELKRIDTNKKIELFKDVYFAIIPSNTKIKVCLDGEYKMELDNYYEIDKLLSNKEIEELANSKLESNSSENAVIEVYNEEFYIDIEFFKEKFPKAYKRKLYEMMTDEINKGLENMRTYSTDNVEILQEVVLVEVKNND